MKRYIALVCVYASLAIASASGKTISGTVLDANTQAAIEYANIMILDSDSTFVKGCVSGNNGAFALSEIPDNAAILKISLVGYDDATFDFDKVDLTHNNIFRLKPTSVSLEEVSVTGNRKPFTIKDEKIVFDPSFVAYAMNANDIIRQAPGVLDTGTSLYMPGKDAIKVYVNSKEQKGSLNDVLLLLKSYPSADVESVEVMTNPSTRYSMGRNVGVINIILKKKPTDFLGGNASYSFGYDTQASNDGAIGLFFQGKRISTSLNVAGNLKKYDMNETNTVGFSDYSRNAQSDITRKASNITLRWNLTYQISDSWDAGLTAYYAKGKVTQNSSQSYIYSYLDGKNEEKLIDGLRTDKSDTYFASFDLNGKLSNTANLTVNADYYRKEAPTERTLNSGMDASLIMHSSDDITSDNITAKANLNIAPNNKLDLNFGADGIFTNSKSIGIGRYEAGIVANNDFRYDENEMDLYAEAMYRFHSKWMLRGGIRYQSIWTEAKTDKAPKHSRHDNAISPSALVSYQINDTQSARVSFYYNIDKPSLTALNPAELYVGNDTYRKGNPELEYGRHYMVHATYTIGSFMVQPYIEWLNKGITEISMLKDDKYQVITWENAVDRREMGLIAFYSYSKLKWMRGSVTAILTNPITTSTHPLLRSRESCVQFAIYPNLQFYLDRQGKWILSVQGNYTGPTHTVDVKFESMWKFDAALTWKPTRQWTLSLSGRNLLHSHVRGVQYIGNSTMTFNNKYLYTGGLLSVSYTWGKSMRRSAESSVLRDMDARTKLD